MALCNHELSPACHTIHSMRPCYHTHTHTHTHLPCNHVTPLTHTLAHPLPTCHARSRSSAAAPAFRASRSMASAWLAKSSRSRACSACERGRTCVHGWVVFAALCLQEWACMHAWVGSDCSALSTRVGVHACACGCGWYLQRFVYKNGRACMRMWVGAAVCLQNWGRVRAWVHSEGDISACVCVCVLQSACGSGGACMRGFTEQVTSAMYSLFLLLAVHHCKLVSRMLRLAISQSPDAHEQSKGAS